jgi:DNA-binding transcriptional MocR family regulator
MRASLLAAGARLVPMPVDEEGIIVDAGIAHAPEARMAYVTPSHQFPLGATLSLKWRLAILDWQSGRTRISWKMIMMASIVSMAAHSPLCKGWTIMTR